MFELGDLIDEKYFVERCCNSTGGMGEILLVRKFPELSEELLALKYCKIESEEHLGRFQREVRLLASFRGNSKVVQVIDKNLDHDPPYFVMKYYADGDLATLADKLRHSFEIQECYFLKMIDCIQELHSREKFHRDIKPQNFLIEGDQIVVSDLGLSTEVGSKTAFTRSSVFWGTHGYIPPEFLDGGFKHADAAGDIFMLGKTMYVLISGRDPLYLVNDEIPAPIFHVIERCCEISKAARYQSLAELKQSLVTAYDVVLGRAGGKVQQLLAVIKDRLNQQNQYRVSEVSEFIEQLALLDADEQIQVCFELPKRLFGLFAQPPLAHTLSVFLSIYEKLIEKGSYSWSYAEEIASRMRDIFKGESSTPQDRAFALDLAIRAATYMNRFAAMDTCRAMVRSVAKDNLGMEVAAVLLKHRNEFISDIESSECSSAPIQNALRQIHQAREQS